MINQEGKRKLMQFTRAIVEAYVKNEEIPDFEMHIDSLEEEKGVFVTLRKNDQLRGCMGKITPVGAPLSELVPLMALCALRDDRFDPVEPAELKEIDIEVSILSPPRKIDNINGIELGRHGVKISKGDASGVFLPQVTRDRDWSKEEFLNKLCSRKAGLRARCWEEKGVEIFIFEVDIIEE